MNHDDELFGVCVWYVCGALVLNKPIFITKRKMEHVETHGWWPENKKKTKHILMFGLLWQNIFCWEVPQNRKHTPLFTELRQQLNQPHWLGWHQWLGWSMAARLWHLGGSFRRLAWLKDVFFPIVGTSPAEVCFGFTKIYQYPNLFNQTNFTFESTWMSPSPAQAGLYRLGRQGGQCS